MRADELMIGDWVSLFQGNCDFSPCNCKVNSISEYEIGIDGCDEYDYATLPLLFPIPLTPEIIEKNGFQYNNLPFVQGWEQFGLTLYSGGNGYRINCGTNVALVIDSVHELQHALKLCGIEKNIII